MKDVMRMFATLVLGLLLLALPAAAQSFVDGIDDLPLMPGLAQTGDSSVFDSPQGRVVEALAEGRLPAGAVASFYARTLLELGWRRATTGNVFVREGEKLAIDADPPDARGTVKVRFFLTPE
jgi:hypothetical protein